MITKTGEELAGLSKEAGWFGTGFNMARKGLGVAGDLLSRAGNAVGNGVLRGYDRARAGIYSSMRNRGISNDAMRRFLVISGKGRDYLGRGLGYTGRNAGKLGAGFGAGMYFGGRKSNTQQPVYRTY